MAAIGVIVRLIGAAVGIAVGVLGGLLRGVLGLLGGTLGLLLHLFPLALITLGIIWLVKGSSPKNAAGVRVDRGDAAPSQNFKGTR